MAVGGGDGIGPWTHPADAALCAHSDGEAGVFRLAAGDCGPSVCSDPPRSTPPKRATRHSRRGDVIAITFHLGYLASGFAFAAIFASAYWRFHMNPIVAFWFAYIVTRPLGASFADWLGVSHARGGTRTRRRTSQPHRRNHHRGDGRRALLARSRRRNRSVRPPEPDHPEPDHDSRSRQTLTRPRQLSAFSGPHRYADRAGLRRCRSARRKWQA